MSITKKFRSLGGDEVTGYIDSGHDSASLLLNSWRHTNLPSKGGNKIAAELSSSIKSNYTGFVDCSEGGCFYQCEGGDCVLIKDKCSDKKQPCGCKDKIKLKNQTGMIFLDCNKEYVDVN